jgi:hypothetical protein
VTITIAGKQVTNPFDQLAIYANRYGGTLLHYDLADPVDPFALSAEDIRRTRKIASRISDRELAWLLERAQSAPWKDVAPDADLGDADPGAGGGLYDQADALYQHFRTDAPRGVNIAKISKVLHPKRPALVPILDSHLTTTYRRDARRAALRHPGRGYRRMYWAAIRDDLVANRGCITALKARCAQDDREPVRRLAQLTDLRVLDILTWAAS